MKCLSEKSSVKCNFLTISEIMKEHPKILLTLFKDLPHYQHFTFYARIRRLLVGGFLVVYCIMIKHFCPFLLNPSLPTSSQPSFQLHD